MRKIEQDMCRAVVNRKDMRNANTQVLYSPSRDVSCVYLHGNLIAVVDKDTVQVYDGGLQSVTTKSRLNALINGLCDGRMFGVYQRDFSWYIQDGVTHQPFDHGHTFPRI